MTIQAWNTVFINSMTLHDFPGPVVTLKLQIAATLFYWCLVLASAATATATVLVLLVLNMTFS